MSKATRADYPEALMIDDFRGLAFRVRQSIAGAGRCPADVDDLVNEGVAAALEALPRHDPVRGSVRSFAYGTARLAMRRLALASHYGVTPLDYRRCRKGEPPPRHRSAHRFSGLAARPAEERESVGRVAAILRAVAPAHRRILCAYLEAGGNASEAGRRLGCHPRTLRMKASGPLARALAAARAVGSTG